MNLNVLYLQNNTGELLFKSLQSELDMVIFKDVKINSLNYMLIEIPDKDSNSSRILNSPRVINSINRDFMSKILEINHIAYSNISEDTIIKSYEVLICDLTCMSIKVFSYGKSRDKGHYIKESENKKAVEMAKRAVYILGLDIAKVRIVLTSKRRYKVKDLETSPLLRKRDVVSIAKNIKEMYLNGQLTATRTVKLGADPEFMLFNKKNDKMLSASRFFPRDGIVGCDNIRIRNRQQRPVAEIRPKPDTSPIALMDNIRYALKNAYRMAPYRYVKWIAGSQPVSSYSIGGHIHFSNIKLNYDVLRALDNYVGITVFLIENPVTAARRRKKYGYLGDYRVKDYGGFEYRTPGSWLVSPDIAAAILCLAKIVTSRYTQLPKKYLNTVEAQKAFYEGDQDFFRENFVKLWANIEKTDMYNEYKEELQIIPYMILNNMCWDESQDFSEQWKLNVMQNKKANKKKPLNKLQPRVNNRINNNEHHITPESLPRDRSTQLRGSVRSGNVSRSTSRDLSGRTINIHSYGNENQRNYNPYGQITSPSQIRRISVLQ